MVLNLFEYSNYRQYLKDFYTLMKAKDPRFSYKSFSEKCGFANKSVMFNIIKGTQNISSVSIAKIKNVMKLKQQEAAYFEKLVLFNQSKKIDQKSKYFLELESLSKRGVKAGLHQNVRKDQYEYYSELHHSVIRSIVDMHKISDDYKGLAKMVTPNIKPLQAKKSLQLLEKLGLIQKEKTGFYKATHKTIKAGNEILELGTNNFHEKSMENARDILKQTGKFEKNFSAMTLGISKTAFGKINEELEKFQVRAAQIAEEDKNSDTVYQMNVQLFQVTDNKKK